MTVMVDDPLIARMSMRRALPLHESSRRLRELYPDYFMDARLTDRTGVLRAAETVASE